MVDSLQTLPENWSILSWKKNKLRLSTRKNGNQIHQDENSLETILSNLPLTLLLFDPTLKLLYANRNFQLEFGKDPLEYREKGIEEVLPIPVFQKSFLKRRIRSILKREENRLEGNLECRIRGELRYYHYRILSIPSNHSIVPLVLLLFENTTLRSNLQKTIQQEEKRLKEIFEELTIGLVILNKNLEVEMVNQAACSMMKFSANRKFIAQKIPKKFYPKEVADTFLTGHSSSVSHLEVEENGNRRIFELHGFPLKDRKGEVVRVIECLRDVTEDRLREENLINMEKLASTGKLAAGLAHELGNPLGIIAGTAQFCLQNRKDYDGIRKSFEVIYRNAQNADRIIKELLRYSRPSETLFVETQLPLETREDPMVILPLFLQASMEFMRRLTKT